MTKNENPVPALPTYQVLPGGKTAPVVPMSEWKPVYRGPRLVNNPGVPTHVAFVK